MKHRRSITTPLLLALALATPAVAVGGEPTDPNAGDTVWGTVGGVRYAAETVAFDPSTGQATAIAGCGGDGWRLVAGGVVARGRAAVTSIAAARPMDHDDEDADPDDGFAVAASGPADRTLAAVTICLEDAALRYRSRTAPDRSTGDRVASIGCGSQRWVAVSGGAAIEPVGGWLAAMAPRDNADADALPDDAWRVTAADPLGGTGELRIDVVCTRAAGLRWVWGPSGTVLPGRTMARTARCAATEQVVGGGVRIDGPASGARLLTSAPIDGPDADLVPDDGWKGRVHNRSTVARSLLPYAICRS